MKLPLLLAAMVFSAQAIASTASANHGHHGGSHGAVGAAAASFGGSAASQSGNGGRASVVYAEDNYQPWPQIEMQQFQKPKFVPYTGE
ncbi:hypothetical protein [Paraburkholderia phenoliruptrix]|uniref:hypothetical protein n=1 Tax=Paraburkholderia phenoliruptrix TaxID=252970 RepID=UPI00286754F9|nr:hypothetical protein [Paraburkholderia phenoliruptrix]MDR6393490.1 hypothetical protein [Paraburkholderia phenoliruptrix]